MTSRPVLIAAVVILTVFIAAVAIWTLSPSPQPPTPTTPSPTPVKNGTATLGELVLCKDFQKVENEISCEEAIRIAKAKYKGTAQEILKGSGFPEKDNGDTSTMREFWRIEILLDNPIQKDQKTFNDARVYLDRKTGEELAGGHIKGE